MIINNFGARMLIDDWLAATPRGSIGADRSYTEFASELSSRLAGGGRSGLTFTDPEDAARYLRHVAKSLLNRQPLGSVERPPSFPAPVYPETPPPRRSARAVPSQRVAQARMTA